MRKRKRGERREGKEGKAGGREGKVGGREGKSITGWAPAYISLCFLTTEKL